MRLPSWLSCNDAGCSCRDGGQRSACESMTAYYNEISPYCVEWLKNLIQEGLIAKGDVDDRPIQEVSGGDVRGYTQCHWFAGAGRWSVALRDAGWKDSQAVWTGSCPCQGFSVSGKRRAFEDPRHLWPDWKRLISECQPTVTFGEQVTGYPAWLNLVRSDLETLGYAVGAMPIEAACAGADHFRERYWFVANRTMAYTNNIRSQISIGKSINVDAQRETTTGDHLRDVVNVTSDGWGEGWTQYEFRRRGFTAAVASIDDRQYVECPDGKWRRLPPPRVRWLGTKLRARIPCLSAIGNSIDTRPATAFIKAYMEVTNG